MVIFLERLFFCILLLHRRLLLPLILLDVLDQIDAVVEDVELRPPFVTRLQGHRVGPFFVEHKPLSDTVDTSWNVSVGRDSDDSVVPILVDDRASSIWILMRSRRINDRVYR